MQISNIITNNIAINNTNIERQDHNTQLLENRSFASRYLIRLHPSNINRILDNDFLATYGIPVITALFGLSFTATVFFFRSTIKEESKLFKVGHCVASGFCSMLVLLVMIIKIFASRTSLHSRNIKNNMIKELNNIIYKNLEKYKGNIEDFNDKLSAINLEELNSKSLKDPIVYDKQFYSFKAFKQAVLMNGKIPHSRLELRADDVKNIKRLETNSDNIQ